MIAMTPFTILFASISVVSALTLAYLVWQESQRVNRNNGMAAFHRHLDALSDDSRSHLRQQLQESRERQQRR
jgi:predicted N-acyltransferase